jgi:hypothetical protein
MDMYGTYFLLLHEIPSTSASPFTVDILVELNTKFREIVTDRLDARSKEAIINQEDPATMTDNEQLKIRKSILHCVYGKIS